MDDPSNNNDDSNNDNNAQIIIISTSVSVIGSLLIIFVACVWFYLCCCHRVARPLWLKPYQSLSTRTVPDQERGRLPMMNGDSSGEDPLNRSTSFDHFVLAAPLASSKRTSSSGWLFGGDGVGAKKKHGNSQISRSIGDLMHLQPSTQDRKKSKGKKFMSMSQDTGMSLDYELELDESLFEKDNFTRPRSKSEDRVIDRRRHSSEDPIISLDSNLRNSTITESEEEEQQEIEEEADNESPSEVEPNEAIASLLMSLAADPIPQDTANSSDPVQDEDTVGDTSKEETQAQDENTTTDTSQVDQIRIDTLDHTTDDELQVSSEQLLPIASQTETHSSSHTLVEDNHSHTASSSRVDVEENGESEHKVTDEISEPSSVSLSIEQESAVALSDIDSMTKIEAQDTNRQEVDNRSSLAEMDSQKSTSNSTIKGEGSSTEIMKGQDLSLEINSQESSSELKGQDMILDNSVENFRTETNDQDLSEMAEPDSTLDYYAQDSTSEIKPQKSTIVMKGREIFSSGRQEPLYRQQDTRITASTGSRVAELREMFLGFSAPQKQKQPSPQRYSQQHHALHNGTNHHAVETVTEQPELEMSNQNHTAEMETIIEVDSEQENSDVDKEDSEKVDNDDEEMLSASRPNLDLTGSEVLLRAPRLTNSSPMKRLSPLALYSRSMSDADSSSQRQPDRDEDDSVSNSSTEQTTIENEFNSAPVQIITRPQWLASQEAEDELSSGESETDLIQPLTPFSGKSNTSNHIQTNGHMHNSPNNLYHLAAKKKAQQRVSEAMVVNTLSSAGRAQVTALTSIPEEY